MSARRFAGWGAWLLWIALLACLAGLTWTVEISVRRGELGTFTSYAAPAFGILLMGWGLWNRRRPVPEVSDREILHASLFSLRRERIPLDDVAGITERGPRLLVLERRSGAKTKIRLRFVAPAERAAAREAIERAVAARGGGATSTA